MLDENATNGIDMKNILRLVFLGSLLTLIQTGCATKCKVAIRGFASPQYHGGKTFTLLPGKKGITQDDLEYVEYAAILKAGLNQNGYSESSSPERADLAIFVDYGIGDPKEHIYSYSSPVYGQVGGGSASFQATTFGSSGMTTTTGTVTEQPNFGVTGYTQHTGSITTYLRFIHVDAFDNQQSQTNQKLIPVWRTDVLSRGVTTDLRRIFPIMIAAAYPYFGKNTGQQIIVILTEDDKRVQAIQTSKINIH